MSTDNKLFIIDAYGFIFRSYYAQKELRTVNGVQVSAVYGFTTMLIKVLTTFKPDFLVAVFDTGGKNFRHQLFDEYKSNRPSLPEELKVQFPLAREVVDALGIKYLEKFGYEADDVIASVVDQYKDKMSEISLISSDKDLMQLVDEKTFFYDALKYKFLKEEDVVEKFGVQPKMLLDYLAITGDASDNIPGIKGLGPKAAVELINEYGNLESIIANAQNIKSERRRQLVLDGMESGILSKKLASLYNKVELSIDDFSYNTPDVDNLINFLKKYEFNSLIPRINKLFDIKLDINKNISSATKVDNLEDLTKFLNLCVYSGFLIFECIQNKIYFCTKNNNSVFYIEENEELVSRFFEFIQEHKHVKKITVDIKKTLYFLDKFNLNVGSDVVIEDILLMTYVTHGSVELQATLFDICKLIHLDLEKHDINIDTNTTAEEDSISLIYDIYNILLKKLIANNNYSTYRQVDLPLSKILFKMEKMGIAVDKNVLSSISDDLLVELKDFEQKIFNITKEEFNINSTKQLGEILFEKLKLPFGKISVKSKNYSTSSDILEKLSESGFIIADYLIEHREISKIKNTYAEGLQNHINPSTERIHTTFNQTYTSTARLSSSNPNLQNIPVKSVRGAKIRKAFVASKGCKIISADYSQVELRILAEIANVYNLKEAFSNNIDVHTSTASKIFKIHPNFVTEDQRRKAKAINFGIIYGISSFGLSKQLKITNYESQEYIDSYFAEYPEILDYMEKIKFMAKKHGYVKNLFGRICYIKGINDKNAMVRNFAQRAAINAPIQSTASDISRITMIKVSDMLARNNCKTNMILQIHDEIIFESPEDEIDLVVSQIKTEMESIHLNGTNLPVDINIGICLK